MNSIVSDSESLIRLSVFFTLLLVLALSEHLFPRRPLQYSKGLRWLNNFGLSVFNTAVVRVLLPIVGVTAALFAQDRGWGLFNLVQLPSWLSIALFLLLFDLAIYFQHRLFHAVPVLWRLHRMHHTDLDYDVSTGNRFHPLSILISSLIKLALIFLLGPLAAAVIIAEVLLNATSMFNHSNVAFNSRLDKIIRLFIVTPDMHRVHHSVDAQEHNRNFSFNFPWWDRLFGTYLEQPAADHKNMKIGIEGFGDKKSINAFSLLVQPLKK